MWSSFNTFNVHKGALANNPVTVEILVILKLTHLRQLQLNSNAIWQELDRLTSKLIWKDDKGLPLYGEQPSSYSSDKMPQQVRWLENLMNLSLTHVGTSSITLSSLPPTCIVTYTLPNKCISLIKKIEKKNSDIICRENQVTNIMDLHIQLCKAFAQSYHKHLYGQPLLCLVPARKDTWYNNPGWNHWKYSKAGAVCVELGECGVSGSQQTG